jgi:hypothetical protein
MPRLTRHISSAARYAASVARVQRSQLKRAARASDCACIFARSAASRWTSRIAWQSASPSAGGGGALTAPRPHGPAASPALVTTISYHFHYTTVHSSAPKPKWLSQRAQRKRRTATHFLSVLCDLCERLLFEPASRMHSQSAETILFGWNAQLIRRNGVTQKPRSRGEDEHLSAAPRLCVRPSSATLPWPSPPRAACAAS